jgi:DNA-3-methyladenine glycosylase
MGVLPRSFYLQPDVVTLARSLLGKFLVTRIDGQVTSGMITETEAYAGITDKASHAYGNRNTNRTEVMFRKGGTGYIYLCYGVHSLFNVVTNEEGIPHAILIRGILPADGMDVMLRRTGNTVMKPGAGTGPGKVAKLLGIHYSFSGIDLCKNPGDPEEPAIWIEDRGIRVDKKEIEITPRIGVDYAGVDALLPYRFIIRNIRTRQR